ncbi:MAG: hypothetical protein WCV82_04220 [Candidatus Paceibacterota bacterium]|jgi:hypothetical protein
MLDTPTPVDEGAQVSFLAALSEEQRSKWRSAIEQVAGENKLDAATLTVICEALHSIIVKVLQDKTPPGSKYLTVANMFLFKKVMEATGSQETYTPTEMNGMVLGKAGYFFKFVCQLVEYPDFGGHRHALGLAALPPLLKKRGGNK